MLLNRKGVDIVQELKGRVSLPASIDITIGDNLFTGYVKYCEESKEALAAIGIGENKRWTERSYRWHHFKADNSNEARQEGLKFTTSTMGELLKIWDPELDKPEPEELNSEDEYVCELEQKVLDTKQSIIEILRKLQSIPAIKGKHGNSLKAAIGALHVLASNEDGEIPWLDEGDGVGPIDAS